LTTGLRFLLGVVLATGMVTIDGHAQTATYPDRPVKMFVGFAAGGGTDVAARIVSQKLTEALGQSVVVENRPGASGMIAAEAVAKSPADGYTLMMGSQTTLAVAPALYRKFRSTQDETSSGWQWPGSRRSYWSFTPRCRRNRSAS
jgi:tripartite-type tricarboxylate transporter receptor subunit TctC